jgi:transcriptional regulator with XRE-family HTH domain
MKSPTPSTSPVKLERIKRSWTQEHLSQLTGLSVRTIQRIENGEGTQAESLRLIAEAMHVQPEALKTTASRIHFGSPWSSGLKVMTGSTLFLLLITGISTLWVSPWIFHGIVALVLLCLAFAVHGYSVKDGQLLIHRTGWSTRYALRDIREMEINPNATMGSIRLFGIGGLFACVGLYRNDILGNYLAYITESKNALVLKMEKRTIVVSPDDAPAMLVTIETCLEGILQQPTE